jgi:hypothetical protein
MHSCTLSHPSWFQTRVFTALHDSSLLRVLHALPSHWRLFISDLLHNLLNTRTHLHLYSHSISISSKRMYVRYKNGARPSQHISICVYHILPRLLAQWSLQQISLPATWIPCRFNHSAYCPPVIPCDVTLHYTAYTTEYTKRWLSFRSPINMLACICTPALNKHKYSRSHTTIGTFIIRMGQLIEMLRNRLIHYAVCIFRYFATYVMQVRNE